jgi:hypothetical protein
LWRGAATPKVAGYQRLSTEKKMATRLANRPRLDTDAPARWLDEIGVPVMLAGAVVAMMATIAGLAGPLA